LVSKGTKVLNNNGLSIDISKFNTGAYILKLSNADYLFIERVVLY